MRASLKTKYHGDYARSAEYVAREHIAYGKLLRALAPYYTVIANGFAVGETGVKEGGSSDALSRFDFAIASMTRKKIYAYVEVTGDRINDEYAYILSEKVRKALKAPVDVFFLYEKRSKLMWRVFPIYIVTKYHSGIGQWIKGEKPYYKVHLSLGRMFRDWAAWLRCHYIPYVERNKKYVIMQPTGEATPKSVGGV